MTKLSNGITKKNVFRYPYGFSFNQSGVIKPQGWDWANALPIKGNMFKKAVRIVRSG